MVRESQKAGALRNTSAEPSPKSCILSITDDNVAHSSFSILVANLSGVQLDGAGEKRCTHAAELWCGVETSLLQMKALGHKHVPQHLSMRLQSIHL